MLHQVGVVEPWYFQKESEMAQLVSLLSVIVKTFLDDGILYFNLSGEETFAIVQSTTSMGRLTS
jgi:hypothetical protein